MATDNLSTDDEEFLAQCEEEFKDRFTDKDEDFMKVFNAEQPKPPIMENFRVSQNRRFNNRRYHPYDRKGSHQNRGYQDRSYHNQARGYQDRSYEDRSYEDRRYGREHTNPDNRNRDGHQSKRGRY